MMKRKSRLSRSNASMRKDRLEVVDLPEQEPSFHDELAPEQDGPLADFDDDVKDEVKQDNVGLSFHKIMDEINRDVASAEKSLSEKKERVGGFLHEVIHLDDQDEVDRKTNLEVAKRMVDENSGQSVLLKAELHDEPYPDAGTSGLVRAEDFVHHDELEILMFDGSVFRIPKSLVKGFTGASTQSAPVELPHSSTTHGGMGLPDTPNGKTDENEAWDGY